jgi:6-phosphogluconate dehydrogenase (decarboxylating)
MSFGLVASKPLTDLCLRMRGKPMHMSQNHETVKKMVSRMEKPRVVFTYFPSQKTMEVLAHELGPLDVVVDCYVDMAEDISERYELCRENSTQYLFMDRKIVGGSRSAYMDNKNLFKEMFYMGPIVSSHKK